MRKTITLFFVFVSCLLAAQQQKKTTAVKKTSTIYYKEKYRPQFHFSPQKFWINDPNGLTYYNGEYHLFFQHNPFENKWGHMSWGHATSKDLIRWKELPVALREENNKMAFSGSIVQDPKNKSGLASGKDQPLHVAVFTAHDSVNQSQHLAYSIDGLRSWQRYSGNPVLDLNMKDFRDPNVFWVEKDKRWAMAVAMPNEKMISIYTSYSLKQWTFESDFGPQGDTSGVWECPDIFQVPVVGEPDQKKWVLLVSQNSSMQYFVGEFSGTHFYNENPYNKIFRPDYGSDYYAAVTYKQTPDNIPVSIGWVNNWNYANDIPTSPWKGAMSLPRQLAVKKMGSEWILVQQPVKALRSLRSTAQVAQPVTVQTKSILPFRGQTYELSLSMKVSTPSVSGIKLMVGKKNYISISYDATLEQLYVDRSNTPSGFSLQYPYFAKKNAYLKAKNERINLRVFVDKSIIEVYANDGELVFTMQVFPEEGDQGIECFSDGNTVIFDNIWFWPMKPIR